MNEAAPPDRDVAQVVAALLAQEPAFRTEAQFGPHVHQGAGPGPSLLIGDQSMMELHSGLTPSILDHRMALLARPGDVVVVRRRSAAFEHYVGDILGLESVTFLAPPAPSPAPVAKLCHTLPELFEPLRTLLRDRDSLTIRSYLTNGHDWRLAQILGDATQCPVFVHGPAPRIARRCNNKLWFWRQTRRVLGARTVPASFHAFGPAAAAAQVARIAASGEDVVIKVPSSAGGCGNLRLPAALLGGMDLARIRALILARLRATGWGGTYPILVGVWETGVTQSPSAQVFIPLPSDGPPEVRHLFQQQVAGLEGEFVGAVPAHLPGAIRDKMVAEAGELSRLLQGLGYFGWCSFDAILLADGTLHWIECNGRWSGVSIPLAAAANVTGQPPRGIAIAQDGLDRPLLRTGALLGALDDLLLRKGASDSGLILLSPPEAEPPATFCAVAIAASQAGADRILAEARRRLAIA
ncbi:hypothetical protein ILP92_13235 [Maribius pontilimi]|uniref:Pre ATP-grasp domain-containing protein n=1 Tax=Palleronia pontilimi TaxID=1964209 RepID=A0A934IJI9_9RHOB|nr:hypothetical protein [Palleronia pontilimi]MBJ3763715.1 hypothetical protein [Palleronia pontilimi]